MQVQSVTGALAGDDLGYVLAHEHIVCSSPGIIASWPALHGGRQNLVASGIRAVAAARDTGVRTIVDCTTFDLGRDAELLVEVSEATGVAVVAATGVWVDPSVSMQSRTTAQLADWFIADLTAGVDGTDIRAGVIKVASDATVNPFAARVLEAAAIAHRETGAPIITHTAAVHRTGEAQAELLERFGVPPERVVIGHSDDSFDLEYLTGLAERGYLIGMDRIPNGALPGYGGQTVTGRMDMIASLVGAGYGHQVVLAHDDPVWAGLLTDDDQAAHQQSNPRSISFISEVVLPGLRERGLDEQVITALTTDNPRRWLVGQ